MAKLAKRQDPAEMPDEDNPEWTSEGFSNARPASEVLPEIFPKAVAGAMLKRGRPRKEVTEAPINIHRLAMQDCGGLIRRRYCASH